MHHGRSMSSAENRFGLSIVIVGSQIFLGFVFGCGLWIVSAPGEAWDTNNLYSVWVFLAGLMSSCLRQRGWFWGVIGLYCGQVLGGLAVTGPHGIMSPLIAVALFGTFQAIVGALLGAVIGWATRRYFKPKRGASN